MITSSATIGSNWFLNGLDNLQRQEAITQRQLSSGFKVQDASDAPVQTQPLIALETRLATFQNWQTNLSQVQAEATAADQALGQGVSLIEQARTIASQGANSTATAGTRLNLAAQVQSLQQQLVGIANTAVQGRYIFAGDQDTAAPYALNSANPNGVTQITSGVSTRVVTDPDGNVVYQPQAGPQIFDQNGSSAFLALQNLSTALANNDQPGTAAALQSLEGVSDWLNEKQSGYGTAEQQITSSQTAASNAILSLQAGISSIRDTDIAQAATDLARETTNQSAAVAAQAELSQKSLFDYLG